MVPTQRLRPVSSGIKILFCSTTIVTPMNQDDAVSIPVHKFELVDFEEIANLAATYDPNQLPVHTLGELTFWLITYASLKQYFNIISFH